MSSPVNITCAMGDIVISGISARLPMSANMEELKENLMKGVNMVTEDDKRWPIGLFGLPKRSAKLDNIDRFDSQFFGVHAKQANVMDPQLRMLLELTFEAIIDSGNHPQDLQGSNTGVFVGLSTSDAIEYWTNDVDTNNGYHLTGGSPSMCANRISFTYDLRGPSYTVDSACSSSAQALYQAFYHMHMGECDSAIVAGANMNFNPEFFWGLMKLNLLSPDGHCKSFDASADGYTLSEGVVVLYLQKKSSALRTYCDVLSVKTNCDGLKEQGITYPSGVRQKELAAKLYNDVDIDPNTVSYVEAHCTGTKVGDPEEINALVELFCSKRKEPLLIGSIKSNLGHTEPVSGLCAIAKIIISMESGMLPPNLHFKTPNPNIAGLCDGRIKVITEVTPWAGGLAALNSFGFGGSNVHVLLKSNIKDEKNLNYDETIPRIVTVSGRTVESVEFILNYIKNSQPDPEFLALVDNVFRKNIKGHKYRGFTTLGLDEEIEIEEMSSEDRPVWFLFSGMGSQWPQMARNMMTITVFRNSIKKSANILNEFDINLIDIIMKNTQNIFENVIKSFVSIAAIQIALTDVLHSLGVRANGFIGHSAGEMGCAYADGGLTAEQMILSAYWRGRCVADTKLINGKMAAVNLSSVDFEARKPTGIYIAGHNSETNLTISGPADEMNKFITELKKDNIFVKEVQTAGVAYHTKYIEPVAALLLLKLKEIITKPKKRTSAWISTSVLEENWKDESTQICSAEYFVNNLVNCVNFHNATKYVPKNAILIEIAPHGLMQAIVKRSLSKTIKNVDLMKRDSENNVKYFLKNIGRLYNNGVQPQISQLYKPVSFPVSRGTAMLGSLIKWDHSSSWESPIYKGHRSSKGQHLYEVDVSQPEYKFLQGHTVDGTIIFPATGYLILAWRSLAALNNQNTEVTSVIFEDVEFINMINIPREDKVKFSVNILEGTGQFSIISGDTLAVTGIIQVCFNPGKQMTDFNVCSNSPTLESNDIYKELGLRGIEISGMFKSVTSVNQDASKLKVGWYNNWITFLDGMIQAYVIAETSRRPSVCTQIKKITIDPQRHLELIKQLPEHKHLTVKYNSKLNIIRSGGVEIRGIETVQIARKIKPQRPNIERHVFIPYENIVLSSKNEALIASLYIVFENVRIWDLKVLEVSLGLPEKYFTTTVKNILETEPKIRMKLFVAAGQYSTVYTDMLQDLQDSPIEVTSKDIRSGPVETQCHLVIANDILTNNQLAILSNISQCLEKGGFILLQEDSILVDRKQVMDIQNIGLHISSHINAENKSYLLLRKTFHLSNDHVVLKITDNNFKWIESLKQAVSENESKNNRVYIVTQKERTSGVMGFVNCLRMEPSGQNIRLFFIEDEDMEPFSVHLETYQSQIQKDLLFNIHKMNQWGSYRHIPFMNFNSVPFEHVYARILRRGDLSSLNWTESPINISKPSSDLVCKTYYSALNFKDILEATGYFNSKYCKLKCFQEDCLGIEYSGIVGNGKRVMGIAPKQALATTVIPDKMFTWSVPDKWTLEQAATIPVVYATVYYGLLMRGCLQSGENILIHSGAEEFSIAAISVALHMGCNIFTTVGSPDEQTFLKNFFPQLSVSHIGNLQDVNFGQLVMTDTKGRGVDIIFNTISNNQLEVSLQCLADLGRIVQIGKENVFKNCQQGSQLFLKNASLHSIDLNLFTTGTLEINNNITRLLTEGIENGAVRPLPVTKVFHDDQLEQAFRFKATGTHVGKVLIKFRNEDRNTNCQPCVKLVNAIPQIHLHANKTYIVAGGLGGVGFELCHLLVSCGAKNLILSSSRGITTGYQNLHISRWRSLGVTVIVSTADITTLNGTNELLKTALKIKPIGGIFNLAASLRDALIENQSEDNFHIVMKPKAYATKHLDIISRKLAPEIDYFVVFSSMTSGRGHAGQTNYGLANSAMERICELRREEGLPGLAIQWGPIGGVGLASHLSDDTLLRGLESQSLPSCLNMLSMLLSSPHPVVSCNVVGQKIMCAPSKHKWEGDILNILGLKDSSKINWNTKLSDLGIDSLMNTEIKRYLERDYNLKLSAAEVRELTFDKLKESAIQ